MGIVVRWSIDRTASAAFQGAWVQSGHPVRPFAVRRLSTGQTVTTHPHLLSPILGVVNRTISTFLIKQTGLKGTQAQTGAVTLIQRFGSAANLNIHLHCLFLDGVYDTTGEVPVFHPVHSPSAEQVQTLLNTSIKRIMKLLTRLGYLVEEQGLTYMAENDTGECWS
jgi:Putative transposase